MSHEPLDRLLGELPRETAGPYFTAQVLARLDRAESRGRRAGHPFARLRTLAFPTAAALGLATLFALATFGPGLGRGPESRGGGAPEEAASRDEARRLLAEIRAEHNQLASELAALRDERPESGPVVYLGGDEKMDLMVDLARVRELPADRVRPAALRRP